MKKLVSSLVALTLLLALLPACKEAAQTPGPTAPGETAPEQGPAGRAAPVPTGGWREPSSAGEFAVPPGSFDPLSYQRPLPPDRKSVV